MRLGEGGELRDERVACEAVGRGKSAGGGIEEQGRTLASRPHGCG